MDVWLLTQLHSGLLEQQWVSENLEDTAAEEALNRDADREQWAKRIQKKHKRLKALHKSDSRMLMRV